jgi:type II secretion system protein J
MNRKAEQGFTLLEMMIALAILAAMSLVLFYSSSQIIQGKADTEERDEVHHSIARALDRMADDLNMAILLRSKDFLGTKFEGETYFQGTEERMDFISLSHLRLIRDAKEGEASEISYYLESDREDPNKRNLMRRESSVIDKDLQAGGQAYPLIEGIAGVRFEYLEDKSNEFKKIWDTQ